MDATALTNGMQHTQLNSNEEPKSLGAYEHWSPLTDTDHSIGTLRVGTTETGSAVKLTSSNADWWEQVAKEAAATANAVRELNAKTA